MKYLLLGISCLSYLCAQVGTVDEGFCHKTEAGVKCDNPENIQLTRRIGQVGEVSSVRLADGTEVNIRTLSDKPLIFEIPHFLTDEECNHFIDVAKQEGLKKSKTERQGGQRFELMDINTDKKLDIKEMQLTIEFGFDIYLEEEDVLSMYEALKIDPDGDAFITPEEINLVTPRELRMYLNKYITENPAKHSRYSNQVWLFPDQSFDSVFVAVQKRVSEVTQLPMDLIQLSDFQVVNYNVSGHYNAHLDSSNIDSKVPCCDRGRVKACRICRYMTVLFYLNDVVEGGETAFPVANNRTLDMEKVHQERVGHLYKRCNDANLRVPAEKGKAIMWYNHMIDEETGWMGKLDNYTLHGGCPVIRGEKWIANFWIKTTESKEYDLQRIRKFHQTAKHVEEL